MNIQNIQVCTSKHNHNHVPHDLVCYSNCDYEQHIEKGYSNAIVNFIRDEENFSLTDDVKQYLSLMKDIFDRAH